MGREGELESLVGVLGVSWDDFGGLGGGLGEGSWWCLAGHLGPGANMTPKSIENQPQNPLNLGGFWEHFGPRLASCWSPKAS